MVWIEIYHLFPGGIIRQVSRAADEGVGLTEFIGSLGPVIPAYPGRRFHYGWTIAAVTFATSLIAGLIRGTSGIMVLPLKRNSIGPLRPHRLRSEQATDHHGTTLRGGRQCLSICAPNSFVAAKALISSAPWFPDKWHARRRGRPAPETPRHSPGAADRCRSGRPRRSASRRGQAMDSRGSCSAPRLPSRR